MIANEPMMRTMHELTKAHQSDQRRLTAVEFQTLAHQIWFPVIVLHLNNITERPTFAHALSY